MHGGGGHKAAAPFVALERLPGERYRGSRRLRSAKAATESTPLDAGAWADNFWRKRLPVGAWASPFLHV